MELYLQSNFKFWCVIIVWSNEASKGSVHVVVGCFSLFRIICSLCTRTLYHPSICFFLEMTLERIVWHYQYLMLPWVILCAYVWQRFVPPFWWEILCYFNVTVRTWVSHTLLLCLFAALAVRYEAGSLLFGWKVNKLRLMTQIWLHFSLVGTQYAECVMFCEVIGFLVWMNYHQEVFFFITFSWSYTCKAISCLDASLLFEAMRHLKEVCM